MPGVEPYETATVVELHAHGVETHLVLTIEAMHDERWTQMAVVGLGERARQAREDAGEEVA